MKPEQQRFIDYQQIYREEEQVPAQTAANQAKAVASKQQKYGEKMMRDDKAKQLPKKQGAV